ncbi:hypothetical protein [Sphingomonas beigongshangi]|uniref:hypothetical protein n=1 Tax=Sphingomonas beigongshangi TaxID=2782540 RepID=UPI001AED8E4A|nr:hypothetical protein [Sphingomonas beigongshangi]
MAIDKTRAPDSTGARGNDVRADDAGPDIFEKARMLVRSPGSLHRNRQIEQDSGINRRDISIGRSTLVVLLMNLVGVTSGDRPAFEARVRHTIKQGVVTDDRLPGAKGARHRRFILIDVLQLALAFQLQRALIDPAAVAAFIADNRDDLERKWIEANHALHQCWLEIEVDAYAAFGGEGKGRPSGRVGALAIAGSRARRAIAEPPLVLRVDMLALCDRVRSSMIVLEKAARSVKEDLR